MRKFDRFDLISFGLLAFISLFSLVRYNYLPQFIDGYYHLSVANGFIQSGGWVGWDWWSFAPFGRPHLYPPLYHFILVFLQEIGLDGLNSLKTAETIIVPTFFFSFWFIFRKLINSKFSFICLLTLSSFFYFYSSVSAHVPATLSLIFGFLSWYFLKRKRYLSTAVCLILSFYGHFAVPWIFFTSLLLAVFFNKEYRKVALKGLIVSLVFVLPLILHFLNNASYFTTQIQEEIKFIHFSLIILSLSLPGLIFNFRKTNLTNLLFLGYILGAALVFFKYPYRFFSAQGIIGLCFFSSLFLEKRAFFIKPLSKSLASGLVLFFLLVFHSTLDFDKGQLKLNLFNSTYYNLSSGKANEFVEFRSIFYPQFYNPIIETIKKETNTEDIIYSNLTVTSQIFASLSQRPSSHSMLWEVKPKQEFKPQKYAKIIIWMKPLIKKDFEEKKGKSWELLKENEMAYVFYNPGPKKIPPLEKISSNISFRFSFFIFLALIFCLIFDYTQFCFSPNTKKID